MDRGWFGGRSNYEVIKADEDNELQENPIIDWWLSDERLWNREPKEPKEPEDAFELGDNDDDDQEKDHDFYF